MIGTRRMGREGRLRWGPWGQGWWFVAEVRTIHPTMNSRGVDEIKFCGTKRRREEYDVRWNLQSWKWNPCQISLGVEDFIKAWYKERWVHSPIIFMPQCSMPPPLSFTPLTSPPQQSHTQLIPHPPCLLHILLSSNYPPVYPLISMPNLSLQIFNNTTHYSLLTPHYSEEIIDRKN